MPRRIGFSTGALATSEFTRALRMLQSRRIPVVELSALRDHELEPLLAALPTLDLSTFSYISFHAPSALKTLSEERVTSVLRQLLPRRWPIIVHPDAMVDHSLWQGFGHCLCIENMDGRKPIGRTVQELEPFFEKFPDASFCFDIGHARQVDPTMKEAEALLRRFGTRLKQVHMSEVNADCKHVAISEAATQSFRMVAGLIPEHVPIVLESVVCEEEIEEQLKFAERVLRLTVSIPPEAEELFTGADDARAYQRQRDRWTRLCSKDSVQVTQDGALEGIACLESFRRSLEFDRHTPPHGFSLYDAVGYLSHFWFDHYLLLDSPWVGTLNQTSTLIATVRSAGPVRWGEKNFRCAAVGVYSILHEANYVVMNIFHCLMDIWHLIAKAISVYEWKHHLSPSRLSSAIQFALAGKGQRYQQFGYGTRTGPLSSLVTLIEQQTTLQGPLEKLAAECFGPQDRPWCRRGMGQPFELTESPLENISQLKTYLAKCDFGSWREEIAWENAQLEKEKASKASKVSAGMSQHPLADMAWEVHELVRPARAKEYFRDRLRAYLHLVETECSRPIQPEDVHAGVRPPALPPPDECNDRQLAHEERTAILAALHDVACPGVEKIGPWAEERSIASEITGNDFQEAATWVILKGNARKLTEASRPQMKAILADVRAELDTWLQFRITPAHVDLLSHLIDQLIEFTNEQTSCHPIEEYKPVYDAMKALQEAVPTIEMEELTVGWQRLLALLRYTGELPQAGDILDLARSMRKCAQRLRKTWAGEKKVETRTNILDDLRNFAETGLKGKERRIVELVCDNHGKFKLADLASDSQIGWDTPVDNACNNALKRINTKLRQNKLPWRLHRHDNAVNAKQVRAESRPKKA